MTDQPTPDHDPDLEQLRSLFWDYLQGELSPEDAQSLSAALEQNPEAADDCRDLMELAVMTRELCQRSGAARQALADTIRDGLDDTGTHNVLAELARLEGQATATLVKLDDADAPADQPRHPQDDTLSTREVLSITGYLVGRALSSRPALVGYAAAVVLLVAVLLIPWGGTPSPQTAQQPTPNPSPPPAPVAVATLTAEHDAQWAAFNLSAGDTLYAKQRLTLTEGFAEITTDRGAVVILEAPATIELIDSPNALRLHAGKLVGLCETDASKGFIVRTPHMDITDLGTRFGVDATGTRATSVHVFDGEVHVARPDAARVAESLRLTANQSARTSIDNPTIARIAHDPEAFAVLQPRTIKLPGTGLGLAPGQPDPAWVVVSKDGVPLAEPVTLRVSEAQGHIRHLPNAPERSQWLAWTPEADSQIEKPTYRIRTTINVPDHIDPATAYLTIQFAADNHLVGLRVNESPVELQVADPTLEWRKLEPIEVRADLMAGTNTIEFEIVNFPPRAGRSGDEAGLRVEWQLHGTPSLFNQAISR